MVLLDADVQGTAATWASDREEIDAPTVACVQRTGNITATVKELAGKYEFVIIDSGGRDSQELRTGLITADLSIHPFRPSQADLDTVFYLSETISQAKDFNATLKVVGLLTMCPTHPGNVEIRDSRQYLADHMEILDRVLHDRKAYRDALSSGLGVTEHNDPKAKQEVINLVEAIING